MKKLLLQSMIFTALAAPVVSWAGGDSGFYVGGSVGQSSVTPEDVDAGIDDDSSAYKLVLGYNLGLVPFIDLAVEADYRDFGSFKNSDGSAEADLTTIDLYGLAGFDVDPIGLFAKLGYSNADGEFKYSDGKFDESDSDVTYGVGAKFQLGSLAIRAEYESFEFEGLDDLYMFSAGAVYTF